MNQSFAYLISQAAAVRSPTAPAPWMDLLRANCMALADLSPKLTTAITVSTQVNGADPGAVDAVRSTSRLLAAEFGCAATVWVSGRSMTVRFARCSDDQPVASPPRRMTAQLR
jgi:hypothetical protein